MSKRSWLVLCLLGTGALLVLLSAAGVLTVRRGKGTFVLDPSRSESANRSRTVHLVIGDPLSKHENDPFVGNILTGLHAALDACGRRIRVSLVDKPARTELEVEKVLNEAAAADSVPSNQGDSTND